MIRDEGDDLHTYTKPDPTSGPPPSISAFRFVDALDVVRWAELDCTIGWQTRPDVWHLNDSGEFSCYQKCSTLDSIRQWAKNAPPMCRARPEPARADCPDRWVVVESRPSWLHDQPIVDERDGEAFLTLRRKLVRDGITLLDAVLFDDEGHWWSMHELTTGTTSWANIG